jgi:hypothetical protein
MFAIAAAARDRSGGHPLWHLLIVAAGAVLDFVAILAKEHWDRDERPQRSRWAPPTVPILALALLSAASGAIHSAVSVEHFQEAFIYGAFFLAASTAQAAWAALLVYRPTRTLLIAGAVGNAATIILWTLTRTVGLPFGPQPWQPETIGTLDVTSTLLELAIVLGAATLLVRRATLTAPDTVTQRLEIIRAQHPAFALEPGYETRASAQAVKRTGSVFGDRKRLPMMRGRGVWGSRRRSCSRSSIASSARRVSMRAR